MLFSCNTFRFSLHCAVMRRWGTWMQNVKSLTRSSRGVRGKALEPCLLSAHEGRPFSRRDLFPNSSADLIGSTARTVRRPLRRSRCGLRVPRLSSWLQLKLASARKMDLFGTTQRSSRGQDQAKMVSKRKFWWNPPILKVFIFQNHQ